MHTEPSAGAVPLGLSAVTSVVTNWIARCVSIALVEAGKDDGKESAAGRGRAWVRPTIDRGLLGYGFFSEKAVALSPTA